VTGQGEKERTARSVEKAYKEVEERGKGKRRRGKKNVPGERCLLRSNCGGMGPLNYSDDLEKKASPRRLESIEKRIVRKQGGSKETV